MSRPCICLGACVFLLVGFAIARADTPGLLGNNAKGEAAMTGIFYDFKQTENRLPSGKTDREYMPILNDFFSHGWDENILNRFYRVSHPLYATQIFIPMFDSLDAPRVFGVEKTVQPAVWIIHYKAQVSPPHAGTYRFVGCADDVMVVNVNHKTVLNGSQASTPPFPSLNWQSYEPPGTTATRFGNRLTYGYWMDLSANEVIDLDIIIGDWPGGQMAAFLLVQEKGVNYTLDGEGNPILPIFQVAPFDTPISPEEPEFAKGYPIWRCNQ